MDSHLSFRPFLRYVWQRSTFYRGLYLAHGIRERDLEDVILQDLPVVTKQMILANFDQAVTDPRICDAALDEWLEHDHDPRSRFLGEFLVLHSTGSSGKQANVVYDKAGWQSMTAAAAGRLYPGKQPAGKRYRNAFYIGDRGHVASATTAANLSPAAFDTLIVSLQDPIEETIARLNAFHPDRLTSYASSLGWLAELAMDGKLKISPQDVVASSDRLTPAVEKLVRQAWNPAIYDLYAATEALFIAIKQPGQSEWKVLDEIQTLEVLDADNHTVKAGETGRAVVTNYANRVLPFIRYDLTDYVIRGETQPGNITLRGYVSRTFENLPIRLDDGQAGEIPSYALANLPSTPDAIQFISHSPDEVEVQYCASDDLDEALRADIAGLQRKWGGGRTRFSFQRVDHIWNDAYALKYKMVRRSDDVQLGLPAHILGSKPSASPKDHLRPGGGFVPFACEQVESSIAALFERQAARSPQATALKDVQLRLSYAELNRAANRVAHALLARKMDPAKPAALLFSHKAAIITAMLGVIKAGGWYAPLDPAHPAARNTAILREIGARLVLTDGESLDTARAYGFGEEQIVNLDELDGLPDAGNLSLPASPDAPVCILYTSGSTGLPKGVVLDQRAVLHRAMLYTNDYFIGPEDRLALLQSFVFSASVREIYAALLNGAGLYLYGLKRDGVHHLAAWLEEEGITVLYMVPAVFRIFLQTIQGEKFTQLRVIRLGGEAALAGDVSGFQRHFGAGCLLANGLAATETGTISQYFMDHQTRIVGSRVPAGCGVQDKEISLLDDAGSPVEDGATGEIVVASTVFGPGNFLPSGLEGNLTEKTRSAERRVIHTGDLGWRMPDGGIMVVGRKDWQVKLRGQRINLVEIEQALNTLENVAEAAVTLQGAEDGAGFLAAYIQPKTQPPPDENALRRGLRALLPEVMIPSVFLLFDPLPRTLSGKVDRLALPAAPRQPLASRQQTMVQPETPTEQALASIWCELLGINQVGLDESFFDLGGDSLQASALMARIASRFQRQVSLSELFQHNTLRGLASVIEQNDRPDRDGLLFPIQPSGDQPPVFFFPGIEGDVLTARVLAANLDRQRPLFGLRGIEYAGRDGMMVMIEQAAQLYANAICQACAHGPYILVGYSFGGHLALETARLLTSQAGALPLVVMIDTYPSSLVPSIPLTKRLNFHWDIIRGLKGPREFAVYFVDRLKRIHLRLLDYSMTRGITRQIKPLDYSPIIAARNSLAAYRPQPYSGRVVLFQASRNQLFSDSDPMQGWKAVVHGDFEIRTIPGDHLNLIKAPYAIELARQLDEVIGRGSL